MKKIIAVVGPTAVGKTGFGLELANKFGGEIISVDSRQAYREMDVVTGKDLPRGAVFTKRKTLLNRLGTQLSIGYYRYGRVKVWLYDVVSPRTVYSAGDFSLAAGWVIEDMGKRGKLPILVGGTGFYLRALTQGYETLGIPPNLKMRQRLESWPLTELQNEVKKVAARRWQKMNRSDRNNPHRLIRVIEIALSDRRDSLPGRAYSEVLKLGFKLPLRELLTRVDRRVEERLCSGAEEEVKKLAERYGWDSVLRETIGYREWRPYFEGQQKRVEAIENWRLAEHHYVKRQLVWFRKEPGLVWFESGPEARPIFEDRVADYLSA